MKVKTYLLIALAAFVLSVTGSDLVARMTIAGEPLGVAVVEHLQWASLTPLGLILLFLPFVGTAVICSFANKRAATRGAAALFFVAMAVLTYFYFDGFQASQQALLDQKWTASALSVGLLPFFVGLPLVIVVATIAAVIALGRRKIAEA